MFRRDFIKTSACVSAAGAFSPAVTLAAVAPAKTPTDRQYWIDTLVKIADPVLTSLSKGQLKQNMPVESVKGREQDRRNYTYLEAFGRLMAGMAPWLELGPDDTAEGKLRAKYLDLTHLALAAAVDPNSPDFMNFKTGGQPVVDAAFLSHALLRAPKHFLGKINSTTRQHLIKALQSTRAITPGYNNWLLFSAMVEMALLKLGEDWDKMRVDYAIKSHQNWYKGDGVYGDGPEFHFDYYNSYVIHPMLLEVLQTVSQVQKNQTDLYQLELKRAQRYAAIQERLISPEGTFPPIGRSLAYRFGAFQLLAQIALMQKLPEEIAPAQVRSGLTAVIKRTMAASNTFDKNNWLTIGFSGHQPSVGETYISTGSLYLCSTGLLPLGLPASDPFWAAPAQAWTAKKAWGGEDFKADHALSGLT
jgi:hypothetical protein